MDYFHSKYQPRPQRLGLAIRQTLKTPSTTFRVISGAIVVGLASLTVAAFEPNFELSSLDGSNGFTINGIGRSFSNAGDVNGDGIDDLIIGSPSADPGGRNDAGQSYVIFGRANSFPVNLDFSSLDGINGFTINGIAAGDNSGTSVSRAGDINGDGIDDIIIGAKFARPDGIYSNGQSYVVFGRATGFPAVIELSSLNGSNGFAINGVELGYYNSRSYSGSSVSEAGDINGDGTDDLIIGAPGGVFANSSPTYVVFGKTSGFPAVLELSSLDGDNGFTMNGSGYDHAGSSVSAAGDINHDGIDDVVIGAPGGTFEYDARCYVVFGRSADFPATIKLSSLNGSDGFILGVGTDDNHSISASKAGDINHDGIDDLIVGAPFADLSGLSNIGQSYIVFGQTTGFPAKIEVSDLNGNNGFTINGIAAEDLSGNSVSKAGDFNSDNIDDLIIGSLSADPGGRSNAGQSYVVYGRSSGFPAVFELSSLNGNNGFSLNGINSNEGSGRSVDTAGDVNDDGIDDLIVGAQDKSYVVFGTPMATEPIDVAIDLLPGREHNCVRIDGAGSLPVAILGTKQVPVVKIDISSLTFAGLDLLVKFGKPSCKRQSVNGDSFTDLVCQFVDDPAKFMSENNTGLLVGSLIDGTPIQGSDKICLL